MTEQQKRGSRLYKNNPAVRRGNWLPHGLWPEMDDLHDRHKEFLSRLADASSAAASLTKSYEAEDEAKTTALAEGKEPPSQTDETARQAALRDAAVRTEAAMQALHNFLAEAIDVIQAKEADWLADLNARDSEAEEKRAEAARLLNEADQDTWTAKRSRMWIERTAKDRSMMHIAYEELSGPVPSAERTLDLEQVAGRS